MPAKSPKFKDPHLWIQSALTIASTVGVSLALSGALVSPTALSDPTTVHTAPQSLSQRGE